MEYTEDIQVYKAYGNNLQATYNLYRYIQSRLGLMCNWGYVKKCFHTQIIHWIMLIN